MAFYRAKYLNRVAVAFSPDGLRWKESPLNPVTKTGRRSMGSSKFDGAYYVNGHAGSPRAGRGSDGWSPTCRTTSSTGRTPPL